MSTFFKTFREAFSGLSRPTWMLAIMVLINRSGFMVLPFLAVYVTEVLHFDMKQAGIILSVYGLGSVGASLAGGWLTDKFGQFSIQVTSQVVGGLLYFFVLQLKQFEYLALGVFLLSFVNDTLRPANTAAVAQYATHETLTRSFSLNRMSVNAGFIVGPALGGILFAISYNWLFIANGIASIVAGIFFFWCFVRRHSNKQVISKQQQQLIPTSSRSPYRDYTFLLFVLLCTCFTTIFFQLFSTLPLYYKQAYQLPEEHIGFLMSLNGIVVLLVEMVLIYLVAKLVKKKFLIVAGVLLLGISFMLFNMVHHVSVLVIAMVLFSLSEILAMPFMSTITAERSDAGNQGTYMGLFTISWAAPLVIAPYLGTNIVSNYGFAALWWESGILAFVTAVGLYFVVQLMEKQKLSKEATILTEEKVLATA